MLGKSSRSDGSTHSRGFQPTVTHDKMLKPTAMRRKVATRLNGGPLAELGAARGTHPIADRENHVEIEDQSTMFSPVHEVTSQSRLRMRMRKIKFANFECDT